MFETTNNTVGFNFMTTSAADAIAYNNGELVAPGVALAMETMAGYTAYFASEDPRLVECV